MIKKSVALFFVLLVGIGAYAQQNNRTDSLRIALKNAKNDSFTYEVLCQFLELYRYSNADSSMYYAKQAINLGLRKNNNKYTSFGYYRLGNGYSAVGKHQLAKETFLKGLKASKIYLKKCEADHKGETEIVACKGLLAKFYRGYSGEMQSLNEFSEAVAPLDTALRIAESIKEYKVIAVCYLDMATLLLQTNKYNEATEYFYKALKVADTHHLDRILADIYYGLGYAFTFKKKYDVSLEKYTLALKIYKALNLKSAAAVTLSSIAGAYYQKKEPEKALVFYQDALKEIADINDNESVINILSGMGQVYISQKKYVNAQECFEKAIPLFKEVDNASMFSEILIKTGKALMEQGKYAQAEKKITEGLEQARKINNYVLLTQGHENMYELKVKRNNYKEALEHYKLLTVFLDSMTNSETRDKMIRADMNYDFEKKMAVENVEKEKKDVQLAAEQKQKKLVSIALAIIFILFILAYVNYRRTNKLNKLIVVQKKELENVNSKLGVSLTQRETLLKEIHHRVKNNMQVISGLLGLQAHNSNNKEVLNVMTEGQNRIKSMALIHQMLYQHENLSEVNFKDYVRQLTDEIASGYNNKEKPVEFNIEAGNIAFNVDTAIPLGLIISELVTNAMKYAYEGKGGVVDISLKQLENENFILTVVDNGKGLPKDFNIDKLPSLGMQLVKMLCTQLRATLDVTSINGTRVSLTFKPKTEIF
ncbi:MAG TPA: histidine kinase dimerization/phosphoacceptor domain -containing protein [Bacteroidia bacterium]|jgi:two-component sensor histidine kinase|nr:histidine kinase dimerization/phosphoacceptor domain -containing protein [Bacteroidia bacterium]